MKIPNDLNNHFHNAHFTMELLQGARLNEKQNAGMNVPLTLGRLTISAEAVEFEFVGLDGKAVFSGYSLL